MAETIPSPLKWHGGKSYLAKRIAALMPPHTHYVEPFFGGGSVLLHKDPEGVSEVANDIHGELANFWGVLQSEEQFANFRRMAEAIPFSQPQYEHAQWALRHCAAEARLYCRAVWFFVVCRQSMAGRMKDFATLSRRRTRRGMNEQASAWLSAVEGLPAVHARLRRVVILNRPALDVIRQQDGEATLFYLDPPYLPDTRATPDVYRHEMTPIEHAELLHALLDVRGKVMLSGYPSPLYDSTLKDWSRVEFDLPNHAAGGASKARETEVLWCNFPVPQEGTHAGP
jgi:DNA adenine methylase